MNPAPTSKRRRAKSPGGGAILEYPRASRGGQCADGQGATVSRKKALQAAFNVRGASVTGLLVVGLALLSVGISGW